MNLPRNALYSNHLSTFYHADARDLPIPDESVQSCITSPPYWGLRDYKLENGIGLEKTVSEYVENLVAVAREIRRVLRDDGSLWLNIGDAYAGSWGNYGTRSGQQRSRNSEQWVHPAYFDNECGYNERPSASYKEATGLEKRNLIGLPWHVAFALQDDGWILRSEIIWDKPNPRWESVQNRPVNSHESIFLFSKQRQYFYNIEEVRHLEFHARNVWTISVKKKQGIHFATFPEELPRRCILLSTRLGDTVLDPFAGSGTTVAAAYKLGRRGIGTDLNLEYLEIARTEIDSLPPQLPLGWQ